MSLLELGSLSSSLHRIVVVLLHTFYLLLRVSFSLADFSALQYLFKAAKFKVKIFFLSLSPALCAVADFLSKTL